jgi:hypothetical protein
MYNPFFHPLRRNKHTLVVTSGHLNNTTEGSEFLDDALRMEDLAMTRTEESVAAGSPDYLL